MSKQEVICVVCPVGCRIQIQENKEAELGYDIEGNRCKKGIDYSIKELTNPTRNITSTVRIEGSYLKRLPVKTSEPIPKGQIFASMDEINKITLKAPVNLGDIVIEDVVGTGVNIVATRSLPKA